MGFNMTEYKRGQILSVSYVESSEYIVRIIQSEKMSELETQYCAKILKINKLHFMDHKMEVGDFVRFHSFGGSFPTLDSISEVSGKEKRRLESLVKDC